MTNDYELECAVMAVERMRASRELPKRVPNMVAIDGRRILFCVVQARIDAEEGGLAYAKADRASGVSLEILEHLPPKTRVCLLSALCFHLHL